MSCDNPAKWIGAGDSIVVHGHIISGGLVYVGELLPSLAGYEDDPSLINPKLPVQRTSSHDTAPAMPRSPYYKYISPQCRDAYLRWLSTGRTRRVPDIGYVLLFLYGLERRLFIDGPKSLLPVAERQAIVHEVLRLQSLYGQLASFLKMTDNLLAMEWVLYRRDQTPPACFTVADRYCPDGVMVKLAYYIAVGKPIHAELAYQTLMIIGESGLRTAARRCREQFRELFLLRFTRQYGNGIVLRPVREPHSFCYHAANPSMRYLLNFHVDGLSNPWYRTDLMNRIDAMVSLCTLELDAYSRAVGREGSNPNGLVATGVLPKELMQRHSGYGKLKSILEEHVGEQFLWVSIEQLYACFDELPPARFRKGEYAVLAAMIESMGFQVAPDVRTHAIEPGASERIVIFPLDDRTRNTPPHRFRIITIVLHLGALLCSAARTSTHGGTYILRRLIDDDDEVSATEKNSLLAFLLWCVRTQPGTAGLKKRLSEISEEERYAIRQILISVAYADGRIDPKEVRQLEKLYTTLGLDKEQVARDLHTFAADSGPVTVGRRESEATFAIPRPPVAPPAGFELNQEFIRIREEETRRVKGVLEEIFSDAAEAQPVDVGGGQPERDSDEVLHALDDAHRKLFLRIVERDRWGLETFDALCTELGVMTDGAMEVLNEWAYTKANAPLLEAGDHVYIDLDLAKEIQNVQ
ncbi:MAG: TerB N-terminal domain-containing protein [Bacteroidia bacterium]|nr:TerB N-terminal domain-containing protein [Bacteroidia bacterium]